MTAPSYNSWHVGMKVVCADDSDDGRYSTWMTYNNTHGLKGDCVYTIRRIGDFRGILCIWLDEIHRPISQKWGECGYSVKRFRPVQTRQTDISCFTAMLSPKPAKAKKVRA